MPWPRAKYFPIQPSYSVNKYIDNVTAIDSWQSGDGDQCVNCSQRAGIHDCDMKLSEKPIIIIKIANSIPKS